MKKLLLAMLLLLTCSFSFSQSIQGTVTDEQKTPLPGVSIVIDGTQSGTTTDFDGKYSIIADPGSVLIFTYLGMKPQRKTVGSNRVINVTMTQDAESLDEVVVTALGVESKKKSLANSIQNIKSEELIQGNQTNMVNGLQGKVSGVTVVNSGGAPGSSSIILIRGGSSITGNNQPLFVVDGIPIDNSTSSSLEVASTNRASDINPADIESVSVLKGPAAAALYGIQAAGGAVIITTKRGKSGVSTVTYSGSISSDKVIGTPKVQTMYGKGAQIRTSGGITYDPESSLSFGQAIGAGTPIFNNIEEFYDTANTQNHNVS